jgi:hypothetical protein
MSWRYSSSAGLVAGGKACESGSGRPVIRFDGMRMRIGEGMARRCDASDTDDHFCFVFTDEGDFIYVCSVHPS